jgi:hypothetical protein
MMLRASESEIEEMHEITFRFLNVNASPQIKHMLASESGTHLGALAMAAS